MFIQMVTLSEKGGIYFDVEYNPKVSVTVSQRDTKKASINGKKYKQIK